jgi:rhodanese-related sulfurtransferase
MSEVQQLHPVALRAALARGDAPVLLDVREDRELELAALPGVVHIPLQELPHRALRELDPDQPLVVVCHHGVRSMAAARFLVERGFEAVWNLTGGIDLYAREADPTVPRY